MTNGLNSASSHPRPEPYLPRKPAHQVVGKGAAWNKEKKGLESNPELKKFITPSVPAPLSPPIKKAVASPPMTRALPGSPGVIAKKQLPALPPAQVKGPLSPSVRPGGVQVGRPLPPAPGLGSPPSQPIRGPQTFSKPAAQPGVRGPLPPTPASSSQQLRAAPPLQRSAPAQPLPRGPLPPTPASPQPLRPTPQLQRSPAQPLRPLPKTDGTTPVARALPTPQKPMSTVPPHIVPSGAPPQQVSKPLSQQKVAVTSQPLKSPPFRPAPAGAVARPLPSTSSASKPAPYTFETLLQTNYTHENLKIIPREVDVAANYRDSQVFGFITTNIQFQRQMSNSKQVIEQILKLPEPLQNAMLDKFNEANSGNLHIADLNHFLVQITVLEKALSALNKDLFAVLNKHGITSDKYMTDAIVLELLGVFSKHKDTIFTPVNSIANHAHYIDMQNFLYNDDTKVLAKNISSSPNTDFIQVTSATSRYRSLFDPIVGKMPEPNKSKAQQYLTELNDKLMKMNSFDPRLHVRALSRQSQFSPHDLSDIRKFLVHFDESKDKGDTIDVKFAQMLIDHILKKGVDGIVKDEEKSSWKHLLSLHSYLTTVNKKSPGLLPPDAYNKALGEVKKSLRKINDRIKSKKVLDDLKKPIDIKYLFKKEFESTQEILKAK
ncbi:MAG: hypothetical protein WC222_03400 [Parachlamydiales bacterium]|jgi:hypothetical protein